ncbi:MAG: hypothetical protein ACK2TX_09670, partial [Anaerolineales bacterium]
MDFEAASLIRPGRSMLYATRKQDHLFTTASSLAPCYNEQQDERQQAAGATTPGELVAAYRAATPEQKSCKTKKQEHENGISDES